jgi:hypothetical protein
MMMINSTVSIQEYILQYHVRGLQNHDGSILFVPNCSVRNVSPVT